MKGDYVRFKNCEKKIKSYFLIYTDFEKVLVSEDNKSGRILYKQISKTWCLQLWL